MDRYILVTSFCKTDNDLSGQYDCKFLIHVSSRDSFFKAAKLLVNY